MSYSPWTDAEDRVRLARRLMAERRWEGALEQLTAAVAVNGFNADWHVYLGRVLDELGRHDEAVAACRRALDLEPENLHGLNHLGVSLHHLGRHGDAIEQFRRAGSVDASFEPAYCNQIRCHAELGDHQAAEEAFYTARLYKEQCPACYFNIAYSLIARGELDRAIFCLHRTLDLAGEDVRVRAKLGETLRQRGHLEQARRQYLAGLHASPDDRPATLDYVALLVQMRRFDEADAKVRHLHTLGPPTGGSSAAAGAILLGRGRMADAQQQLRSALSIDPTLAGANLMLAQIAVKQADTPLAKQHLRAELLLRPEAGQILLDLANMLLDVGELRTAVACLRRLVQTEPRNAKAWQNLGVAEALRGRHAKSIDATQHATKIDPGSVSAWHNLALAHLHAGCPAAAAAALAAALALSPQDRHLKKLQVHLWFARHLGRLGHWLRQRTG